MYGNKSWGGRTLHWGYQVAIIVLVNLFFYIRTWNYHLVSDDLAALHRAKDRKKDDKGKETTQYVYDGSTPLKRWWLEFHNTEAIYSIKRCHIMTTFVHIINCVLIYLMFGSTWLAFWTAILFSINPSNNQGAIWISGRGYAVSTTTVLIMWWLKPIAPLAYLNVFHWAVNGVVAPILFIYEMQWWWVIPACAVTFILNEKWGRSFKKRVKAKEDTSTKTMIALTPNKLVLYFKSFWYYLLLSLFPARLGMYHTWMYTFGVSKADNEYWFKKSWGFWVGLPVFILYVTTMFYFWRTPLGFGMFWWVLFISPFCHLKTVQQAIAERYNYLPNVGLMYGLAWAILKLGGFV